MNVYDIIKKPVVTEKTELLRKEYNKYTFEVHPKANKIEIKKAVDVQIRTVSTKTPAIATNPCSEGSLTSAKA